MKKPIAIALLLIPCLVWGQKKETEVTADISGVTVYTSGAEVNYEKEMLLPRGTSTVVFTDLTPFIVENSVNVSVSDPLVNIMTVAERINYAKEKKSRSGQVSRLQDSVIKMNRELGLLHCREETAEVEKSLLFKNEAIGGLSTHGVAVSEIEKASAFFYKRYSELTRELFFIGETERDLSDKIKRCQGQAKELETVSVQTTSEIRVTVSSQSEEKVTFRFKFLTSKAGWAPMYDFKYEGPSKPLAFVFRANVFNASGTPWQDVSLKLSTADPVKGFALPSSENDGGAPPVAGVKFKQVEVVNAIVEYTIAQQYSVPSDARPYLIDVSAYTMPASYSYMLIPKLDPFGFLMAKIPGWNMYNLIPGTANIYNSGTYMGKTFLDTYAENDTLGLYLGKDKNLQAARNEKTVFHPRPLVGNYTIEETATDITVKNNFKSALPVEMIDQVPVYTKDDREKLTVFNVAADIYNRADGMLTWHYVIAPGQSMSFHYKYEIKAPKEDSDGSRPKKKKFRTIACPSF